jgi:biopolymer transport protein ExbB
MRAVDDGRSLLLHDGGGSRAGGGILSRDENPVRAHLLCAKRLTVAKVVTEDTEKTVVFLYSKLKQQASRHTSGWTRGVVMLHCNAIIIRLREMPPGRHRAGQSETVQMLRSQRINSIRFAASRAVAASAAVLFLAVTLMPPVHAQTSPAAVTAPSSVAPAAAAPTAPIAPAAPAVPSAPSAAPPAAPAMSAPAAAAPPAAGPATPAAMTPAAAQPAPGEPAISAADLPEDLSPWGMFENADIIVKAVIIGLAFASLVTWTVWLAKTMELRGARSHVRRDIRILNGSATFAQAHEQLRDGESPVAQLMQSAAQEIRLSANLRAEGLKERIALQLERIEMAVSRKISRGTGVLATIGSTAPFVGLFGTVWGIMNSFIGISNAHTTNLAVVAPGIAQALLATAFGLVAAIPAVMIYNVLARQTAHYRAYLGDASAQVMRLVSRDLDRAKLPMAHAAE